MLLQNAVNILVFVLISFTTATLRHNSAKIKNDVLRVAYKLEEKYLNHSYNPCDNFYDYVCADNSQVSKLDLNFDLDLSILTEHAQNLSKSAHVIKNFYESCRDVRNITDLKSTLMYRTSGGWPALENSSWPSFKPKPTQWLYSLTAFHVFAGKSYLFKHSIEIKSNRRVVTLQPSPPQPVNLGVYENNVNEILAAYRVDAARARLIALETLNFERALRGVFSQNSSREVKTLTSTYGSVRNAAWDNYFKKLFGKPPKLSDTIIMQNTDLLDQLDQLMGNTSLTRFLNWIWIDYLMDKRSENCRKLTVEYFKPVLEYHLQKIYNKADLVDMFANIHMLFRQHLANSFDETTKQSAQYFVSTMMSNLLDNKLDEKYATLQLGRKNFFRNLEKVHKFVKLQKPLTQQNVAFSEQISIYNQHFAELNKLMALQNLTAPLNYIFSAQKFVSIMTLGSNFNATNLCVKNAKQQELLMGLLTVKNWISQHTELAQSLDDILVAGTYKLTLTKLYFIGSTLLNDCAFVENKYLLHENLRSTAEFSETFNCQPQNLLFSHNVC